MNTSKRYSPEVRERAVRMLLEQQTEHSSQWATIQSIVLKIGCTNKTLRRWVRQVERDQGSRVDMTSDDREASSVPLGPWHHDLMKKSGKLAC